MLDEDRGDGGSVSHPAQRVLLVGAVVGAERVLGRLAALGGIEGEPSSGATTTPSCREHGDPYQFAGQPVATG